MYKIKILEISFQKKKYRYFNFLIQEPIIKNSIKMSLKLTIALFLFVFLTFAHTEPIQDEPLPKLDFTCTVCVILANGLIHGVSREREALKRALSQVCNIVPRQFNSTVP